MTEQAQRIELPDPNGAFVMRAVTNQIKDDGKGSLVWITGEFNPLAPKMKIVRMYSSPPEAPSGDDDESAPALVDNRRELRVYSVSPNKIIRHIIPPDQIRLIEESLTLETFLEEIDAEEGIEDDEDPENPLETTADTQPPPPDGALS